MQINEILLATGGKCLNSIGNGDNVINGIYTDSRADLSGGLFIPLIGEKFDAHQYINTLFDKGAVATLTSKKEIIDDRLITIYVEDTRGALLDLAKYVNQKYPRTVVAITGSVGKTTTKEMVSSVLETSLIVHKTQGNFNNDIGVPLTLFRVKETDQVSVIEMGMNHFGEISTLTKVATPDIAIITNIGTSHIENLGSRKGILQAKLEILEGLKPNGTMIINGDEPLLINAKGDNNWITFGLDPNLDYYATNITQKDATVLATVHTPTDSFDIDIPSPGEHMVKNALVAIIVGEKLGLSKENIIKGIKNYKSEKMRMQISKTDITIIDDTYNASYDSMIAAINVLANYNTTKVAILGDMFELGEFAEKIHYDLGKYIQDAGIDCVYTIGSLSEKINEAIENSAIKKMHFATKELFLQEYKNYIKVGDTVLLKASRGMHFEQIVETIRKGKYYG
ncbi:MAG: hypothetical protein BEN19_08465 [Epulopiscium sp. Nuni2H_MBin003]|nr:MAG: hypothetical protein BEN19_08465 [Epulopiscium sp. Nuni2H_MBin003]